MIFPAFPTLHGNFCGRLPSDFLRSALYPSAPYPRQSPNGYFKIYLLGGVIAAPVRFLTWSFWKRALAWRGCRSNYGAFESFSRILRIILPKTQLNDALIESQHCFGLPQCLIQIRGSVS